MGRYALIVVSVLAWAGFVVEFFADVLNGKQFAGLLVVATLATSLWALQIHSQQIQKTLINALKDHAAQLSRHQSLLEKMVGVWNHGNVHVGGEVNWAGSLQDTGPFPIHRNGSMS